MKALKAEFNYIVNYLINHFYMIKPNRNTLGPKFNRAFWMVDTSLYQDSKIF